MPLLQEHDIVYWQVCDAIVGREYTSPYKIGMQKIHFSDKRGGGDGLLRGFVNVGMGVSLFNPNRVTCGCREVFSYDALQRYSSELPSSLSSAGSGCNNLGWGLCFFQE